MKLAAILLTVFFCLQKAVAEGLARSAPSKVPARDSSGARQAKTLPAKLGPKSRVGLDASRAIRVNYGYPAWNKSPTVIDSGSLILREGSTGKIVQIQLEETEPDSSVFSGLYSVQWEKIGELAPEFYVPPASATGKLDSLGQVSQLIQAGKLKRMPFILRRAANGQQFVEVFDSRDQARAAIKAYRDEKTLLELQKKKVVSESAIDVSELAKALAAQEAAAKAAADRVRLEQVESLKDASREAQFKALPLGEQKRRAAQAQQLSTAAMALYRDNKFAEAETKFAEAVSLDPITKSYYFQYGVTLYKLDKFNPSLVFLGLASGKDVSLNEREFYRGLNFYRLKDFPRSVEAFGKVEAAKDPALSAPAAFYSALVLLDDKQYEKAKEALQRVLDGSNDPKLDEKADQLMEQILRIQQFEAERAKKWSLSATAGVTYDNNILQISDSQIDSGTASDTAGYRLLTLASLRYRPVYETNREWATQLDVLNMYTVSDKFKTEQTLRNTDPLVATLTAPWTHKGTLFKKGHKLDLVPGAETIVMSVEDNKTKPIVTSGIFNVLNTLVLKDSWFVTGNLEMRYDSSGLNSSTGDNDSTAIKVKGTYGNMIFLSEDKSRILTADLAYSLNQARGNNAIYNRIDTSVGYIGKAFWELVWNSKLAYANLVYPSNPNNRKDDSYTLSLGASRKLTERYSLGLNSSYNINKSTVDTYDFKKASALVTVSGAWEL